MKRSLLFIVMIAGGALFSSCNQQPAKTAEEAPVTTVEEKKVEFPADALRLAAVVTLKDSTFKEAFEKAAEAVVAGTHQEEGNLFYELGHDKADPLVYVFFEVWKSQEALDAHGATPHFKAFTQAIEGKTEMKVHITTKRF